MEVNKTLDARIMAELNTGIESDAPEPGVSFAVQLDVWFQLDYGREGIRVQYQRMVAMGQKTDNEPNLKPVIAQFAAVKEEMAVVEDLMAGVLEALDNDDARIKMLDGVHYIPQKGITLQVPAELRARLLKGK
ncbi:hypothetical protein LCGC14_0423400 [marine sediment metagenome]|uniref:Uncharacterized protein n=1 Tax=marine sediment metagenome TaxID=412755 RepID=A0A0F9T877_9ZZZZ